MNDLNNVPKTGTFGSSVDVINGNFELVQTAISQLEDRTSKFAGFFQDAAALQAAIPSPTVGMWADVGSTKIIYRCNTAGTWTETEETDSISASVSYDVIDNLTSTSTTKPLSANQGKLLKEIADDINNDITVVKENVQPYQNILMNKAWLTSTGNLIDSESYDCTGLIRVTAGREYEIDTAPKFILFFGEDKSYISYTETTNRHISVGDGVGYIAIDFIHSNTDRMLTVFDYSVIKVDILDTNIKELNKNIQLYQVVNQNKAWLTSTGSLINSDSYDSTGMIRVTNGKTYMIDITPEYVLYFDSGGNYIGYIHNRNTLVAIGEGVSYVAFNFNHSASDRVLTINDTSLGGASELRASVEQFVKTSDYTVDEAATIVKTTGSGWVTNIEGGGAITFRATTSSGYGYIKLDVSQFVKSIIVQNFTALASVQSGLLTGVAFINSEGIVTGVKTYENSQTTAYSISTDMVNVPDGSVYAYINIRSDDNTSCTLKKYSISDNGGSGGGSQSPLLEKSLYNDGDSVARGAGTGANHQVSAAEQIAVRYGMTLTHAAVSGTTIGYKDSDPTYADSIPTRMIANLTGHTYDYILFNGGFNDLGHCQLGTITPDYTTTPDPTTTIGGLETICKWLMENMPDTKKLFVLDHRWTNASQPTYWAAIVQVLKKWGIPYVNIYEETQLYPLNAAMEANWFYEADGLHPNTAAYTKFYVDKIAKTMEGL